MKITKKYIQNLIKEETAAVLKEMLPDPVDISPVPQPSSEAVQGILRHIEKHGGGAEGLKNLVLSTFSAAVMGVLVTAAASADIGASLAAGGLVAGSGVGLLVLAFALTLASGVYGVKKLQDIIDEENASKLAELIKPFIPAAMEKFGSPEKAQ